MFSISAGNASSCPPRTFHSLVMYAARIFALLLLLARVEIGHTLLLRPLLGQMSLVLKWRLQARYLPDVHQEEG
jgi:hypothetical protein